MADSKKDKTVSVRMTYDDYENIKLKAAQANYPVSSFLLQSALGVQLERRDTLCEISKALCQHNCIVNDLPISQSEKDNLHNLETCIWQSIK